MNRWARIPDIREKESQYTFLDDIEGTQLTSQRSFLTGSAAALAGDALMAVPGAAFAKSNGEDEDMDHGGKRNNGGVTDILNYALVLERLEYEFYRRYLNRHNERQIEGAAIFEGFGNKVRSKIYQNLKRIRAHEETHVKTLIQVIQDLGASRWVVPAWGGRPNTPSASVA
jgi:hypothetical protein